MWMTPDGVRHTRAPEIPALVMTDRMWDSLVSIAELEGERSAFTIDDGFRVLLEDLDQGSVDLSGLTPGLEERSMPDEHLDGEFASSEEVRAYLDTVSIDWRFEAFETVADLLRDFTGTRGWRRLRRSMSQTGETAREVPKYAGLPSVLIALAMAVLTVRWATSSHPWAAVSRGLFTAYFIRIAIASRDPRQTPFFARPRDWSLQVFGALFAMAIALLWAVANRTGDAVYRHEAMWLSIWGGSVVLTNLAISAALMHPKTRARLRATKTAATTKGPKPTWWR